MRKKIKTVTIISVALNLLGVILVGFIFFRVGGFGYLSEKVNGSSIEYDENIYYIERTSLFDEVEIPKDRTILVGDSITQRGLWNEMLPDSPIINRGINSDSTEGILNRLRPITDAKPEKIFLMAGINDLYAEKSVDEIVDRYGEILRNISAETPETEVYVQSVLPLNYSMYFAGEKIKNETIQELNSELLKLSGDSNATYIDLYPLFEKDGQLNEEFTFDGIHLTGKGYAVWENAIYDYIK